MSVCTLEDSHGTGLAGYHFFRWTGTFPLSFSFVLIIQSCPALCDPMDCNPPSSSVHGISQARILEWAAISFFRGVFLTQGPNLHLQGQGFFTTEPPGKSLSTPSGQCKNHDCYKSFVSFVRNHQTVFHRGYVILHSYQQ